MRIGVIGFGTVGRAIANGLGGAHEIVIHDPSLDTIISDVTENTEMAYICVPTPTDEISGACDISIVKSVIEQMPDGFSVVIKSTVIPGTTQRFHDQFPKLKVACSPEFLRSRTANIDFLEQDILVVGTHHDDLAEKIHRQHKSAGILTGERGFFQVRPTQAELIKYFKNVFLATKVIFVNQFQDICLQLGEDWSEIKEIVTHPQKQQIGSSHLDELPHGKRGFGGDCLPKDTLALYTELTRMGIEYELIRAVIEDNLRIGEESH